MRRTVISFVLLLPCLVMATFQEDVVRLRNNLQIPIELSSSPELLREMLSHATLVKDTRQQQQQQQHRNRRLEDEKENDDDYYVDEMYSFSGYSLKYAKCQTIQRFSEAAIQNGEYSPMVKDDVVILRLCPTSQCSTNRQFGCHYNYAEYAIGINEYIRIMIRYTVEKRQNLCQFCATCNYRRLEDGREDGEQDEEEGEENNNNNVEDEEEEDQQQGEDNNGGDDNKQFDDDDYYKEDDDGGNAAANDDAADDNDDNNDDNNDDAAEAYNYCQAFETDCSSVANWCNGQADDDTGYLDYMDYLDFLDCVKVEGQDNYGDAAYWIKPRCDSSQGTIMMSIFYDPYCSQYAGDEVNLREFSGIYFRNSAFEEFYAGICVDCSDSVSSQKQQKEGRGASCLRSDLTLLLFLYFRTILPITAPTATCATSSTVSAPNAPATWCTSSLMITAAATHSNVRLSRVFVSELTTRRERFTLTVPNSVTLSRRR